MPKYIIRLLRDAANLEYSHRSSLLSNIESEAGKLTLNIQRIFRCLRN